MTDPGATKESIPSPGPGRALWLAPILSGVLLYLSFFPAAIEWLAWVALVPVLALTRLPGRPRRLYLAAYLGACVFYFPALQWFRVAHPAMYPAWIALSLYCAAYVPLVVMVVRSLLRRTALPLTVAFPLAWVSGEFLRYGLFGSFVSALLETYQHDIPGGFSWYFLGHTQHDFLEMIQVADLTGVYGVSFLVAAVNVLLFESLWARVWFRRLFGAGEQPAPVPPMALLGQGLVCAALAFACLGYGVWRLSQAEARPGPLLAILQTNVPQGIRNDASTGEAGADARAVQVASFSDLMDVAAKAQPDLIVTPETSYPGAWRELRPGQPTAVTQKLALAMVGHVRTPVLLGMGSEVFEDDGVEWSYNSAILIDRQGRWQGRYDKVHLVPFGEYVPVKNVLPFLRAFVPYDFDYAVKPGASFTRFFLPVGLQKYHFGVLICYEDTDPMMARPYATAEPPPVDFLLNISNDGWFDGTSEHEQHLAIGRFRAVESRRPLVRAVNMGISAVIDANGRVLRPERVAVEGRVGLWKVPEGAPSLPVSDWHEYKSIAGVLLARVPLDDRGSLYAQHGDWFAAGCLVTLAAALAWGRFRRRGGPS